MSSHPVPGVSLGRGAGDPDAVALPTTAELRGLATVDEELAALLAAPAFVQDVVLQLPEGVAAPAGVPTAYFAAAVRTHLAPRRLDMQALAAELGVGRTTLYRRVGDRDRLLGEVLWYLTRRALADVLVAPTRLRGRGRGRVVEVVGAFMHEVHASPAHRRFLEEEPVAAMRILTSKEGFIQTGITRVVERLLLVEVLRGTLALTMEPAPLAFAVVRIAESFLYADVLADKTPDIALATEVIDAILRGTEFGAVHGGR